MFEHCINLLFLKQKNWTDKCFFQLVILALSKFRGKLFIHIFCRKMPAPIGLIDSKSFMNVHQWEMIFRITMKEIHSKKTRT